MCGDRTKFLCAAGGGLGGQERRAAAPLPPANCTNILVQLPYSSSATAACPACPAQIRCGSRGEEKSSSGRGSRCRPAPRRCPLFVHSDYPSNVRLSTCAGRYPPPRARTWAGRYKLSHWRSCPGKSADYLLLGFQFSGFWLYVGTGCRLPSWCPRGGRWVGPAPPPASHNTLIAIPGITADRLGPEKQKIPQISCS